MYFIGEFSFQAKLRQQLQIIDNDPNLDFSEKSKRKQNLLLIHNLSGYSSSPLGSTFTSGFGSAPTTPSSASLSSIMSPHAPSFYPAGETVESVIGEHVL